MVTITQEPLKSNLSIGTLAKYDTKAKTMPGISICPMLFAYNPDTLTAQQSQQLSVAVRPIARFYAGVRPRLKKLEPYLKVHTHVYLELIYKDIEMAEILLAIAEDDMKGI